MAVVGGHQWNAGLFFQTQQIRADAPLLLETLILNLQKEIVCSKDLTKATGGAASRLVLSGHQVIGNLTGQASRKTDKSPGMGSEKVLADPRLVVETMQRSLGSDLDQISISLFIFRQHHQVMIAVAIGRSAMVGVFADVKLAANDGLHLGLFRGIYEMNSAVNVAVIGHGNGCLAD